MESAGIYSIPAAMRFRRHEHEGAHLCAVFAGGLMERQRDGWQDMAPGAIRISGSARHDIDFGGEGARCLMVVLDADTRIGDGNPRFLTPDPSLAPLLHRVGLAVDDASAARRVRMDGAITELVAQVTRRLERRRLTSPPPWLARAREMLDDLRGFPSVRDLATALGVHRVHLARTFREHVGVSITDYARKRRIVHATELLATGNTPLVEVALQSGFADQAHLTRAIRSATGQTPGALRDRANGLVPRRNTLHRFKTVRTRAE